jgi:hypothetical protein
MYLKIMISNLATLPNYSRLSFWGESMNASFNQSESFLVIKDVVECIADLVCCHGFDPNEDGVLRNELVVRGFELDVIRKAEDWCDQVALSGRLIEVLSLFQPTALGRRVHNPLEKIFVSEQVWKTIEACRSRGIFSLDMHERLLEGVRAMDTRDWDDQEVKGFIEDACGNVLGVSGEDIRLRKALNGDFGDYYC